MMRPLFLFLGYFVFQGILAQVSVENTRTLEWAEYYYMNKVYDKAQSHYLKVGEDLPLESRRNFSKIYALKGQLQQAAQVLRPLVDSDSAQVNDYYYFASYLTDNDQLRDEYRRKAIRLHMEEVRKQSPTSWKSPYQLTPLTLNTEGPEFGAHLMTIHNNTLLIYTQKQSNVYTKGLGRRMDSKHSIFNLYQAQWNPETFQTKEVQAFPLGVNSVFQDGPSSWDPNDQILYLTRSSENIQKQKALQLDIYAGSTAGGKKQIAQPLPFNIKGYSSLHPAVSEPDRRLYFASDRPGGFGGMDLYYADILGGENYSSPVNLGPDVNTQGDEVFPFVHQGKYLFYSAKTGNGKLSPKLAINTVDVRWNVMELPSPFKSKQDDFSFYLEENLDYGFLSSNREQGKGDDDLYAFKFTPQLAGLEDAYTYNPIDTLIVSQNSVLKNDEELMGAQDPLTALFQKEAELVKNVKHGILQLNPNGTFLYKNLSPTAIQDSFTYTVKSKYGKSKEIKVLLQRAEVAMEQLPEVLKKTFLPIFYPFNNSNLLIDYKDRVDAVIAALKANPHMIVEVSSYSDCRGSKAYNLKLSQERNQTIIDYIKEQIETENRIFGKGYGEETIAENTSGDYLIVGGAFFNQENALTQQKVIDSFGYKSEIQKLDNGVYRIIVGQADSYAGAQEIVDTLLEKNQKTWIKKSDCDYLSEAIHLQNRRTDFKVIRY